MSNNPMNPTRPSSRLRPAVALSALALAAALAAPARADVPAPPVLTLYSFNGPEAMPYYEVSSFLANGPTRPAGRLAQGSSVVPCLVIENGRPLTDKDGVPYVGFHVVVDAARPGAGAASRFLSARQAQQNRRVRNHHCPADVRYVTNVRKLYDMNRPPFFEPPPARSGGRASAAVSRADGIVRAFHNSRLCAGVNERLMHRRAALEQAWARFAQESRSRWDADSIHRARNLDYVMRTAIFEGHLGRGCNAYGTCERNIIALSIRNRALEGCGKHHGCRGYGDFVGVSSIPSQYNIWDEFITQSSGLTSCFLRDGGGSGPEYRLYRNLYEQNVADVERILYGTDADLMEIFPGTPLAGLKGLKHYYHAPAMGKCFPQFPRVEYISGAVARRGDDFVLLADTRVQVGERAPGGYFFKYFKVRSDNTRDSGQAMDLYPGFVLDGRRVSLKKPTRCAPFGIPAGCGGVGTGRWRKTPTWVNEGRPIEVNCRVRSRGAQCGGAPVPESVRVGGVCDVEMRPFSGIR